MTRPGFALAVESATEPVLVTQGTRLRMERMGAGTQVIYPPDPQAITDPVPAIRAALAAARLADRLDARMRLTVVVDDDAEPRPRMRLNIRRLLIEQVLELAVAARVDDVQVLVANGLRRRPDREALDELVGERVTRSFATSGGVRTHDATAEDLVPIGEANGQPVTVDPRVARSDLVVAIAIAGAQPSLSRLLALGITDAGTVDRADGLHGSASAAEAVAAVVTAAVPVAGLVAALGEPDIGGRLDFLTKREWEWSTSEKLAYGVAKRALSKAPKQASHRIFGDLRADYPVLGVWAGEPAEVDAAASSRWRSAHSVQGPATADVLTVGVWGQGSGASDLVGDPLTAAHNALVEQPLSAGGPLVRDGGVVIAFHPLKPRFATSVHGASADFFAEVLVTATDPAVIHDCWQDAFTEDDWYMGMYRQGRAYHPLWVFHRWYRTVAAAARLSDVIWVAADRQSAARMGFRAASTFADALEIAAGAVGRTPAVTMLHGGLPMVVQVP